MQIVTRKQWKDKPGYDPQIDHLNEILSFIYNFVIDNEYWVSDRVEVYLRNHLDNLLAEDWEEIK